MSDEISSPCIKKCSLDEQGLCTSCLRSIHEITVWPYAGNEIKRKIMGNVRMRKDERDGPSEGREG